MSSSICFTLDQSKILSSGNGLKLLFTEDIAVDKLLSIAEDAEAQKLYKQKNSQLRKIAEGMHYM